MPYIAFIGVAAIADTTPTVLESPSVVTIDRIAAGWAALANVYFGGGVWLALGTAAASPYIFRSTDFVTWTRIDIGDAGNWAQAAYDQGAWVLMKSTGNKVRRSTDAGLTWAEVTLPVSAGTWGNAIGANGRMMWGNSGTPNNIATYSTDGGATWTGTTQLPNFKVLALSNAISLGITTLTGSTVYVSTDNGVIWTDDDSNWPIDPFAAIPFNGRLVVSFSGAATTARYRDPGGSWVTVTLPASITNGTFMVIGNVLYMCGTAAPLYSTDGVTWGLCTGVSFNRNAVIDRGLNQPITFMPGWSKPTDAFPELARYPLTVP